MKATLLVLGTLIVVHCAVAEDASIFALSQGDATKATIQIDPQAGSQLTITMAPAKQKEFAKFTKDNIGKKTKLVIGGKVVAEPVVMEQITGGSAEIATSSAEAALDIAKALFVKQKE